MYRVIKASEQLVPFEHLPIRTFRLHPEYAYTPMKTCDFDEGQEIRRMFKEKESKLKFEIRTFEIESLITDQQSNNISILKEMYEKAPTIFKLQNLSTEFPIVVQYHGNNYLLDGNTRTSLIYYLGGRTIKCRYYNLDKEVVNASSGDVTLYKFLVIPTDYVGDFPRYRYDIALHGYLDLWEYRYNILTKETDDRLQSHGDHIDILPFELKKIYRRKGYWGKTDWFRDRIRFFVNDEIGNEKESYLKKLCNVR